MNLASQSCTARTGSSPDQAKLKLNSRQVWPSRYTELLLRGGWPVSPTTASSMAKRGRLVGQSCQTVRARVGDGLHGSTGSSIDGSRMWAG